jgi:Sortase domain
LPEERKPAGKWWLAEEQGPAEQRESAETQRRPVEASRGAAETPRESVEASRKPADAPRGSAEAPRRSAETQPVAVKRGLDEKWWLAAKQGSATKQGPATRQGSAERQGLAGKQGLAERRDSAETQPLPVIRGPLEKHGAAPTPRLPGLPEKQGLPEKPGLPEDWWDPGWQAIQSPGAAPLQREILKPASGTGLAEEVADEAPPSWHQALGATFSLWTGRHLRWLRGAPGQGRGRLAAATALAAGLVAVGIGAGGLITANVSATPTVKVARPTPIAAPTEQTVAPAVSVGPAGKAQVVAKPVWVSIPAIGIKKTKLIHLGLTRQGTLQVPRTTTVAGWFTGGPRPGAVGSAVIAGHVDSKTGPGIFFWLRALKPGDKVYVGRADGTMAVFTVTREHMYAKDRFPTKAVYGAVPDAELRLITCGGIFDRSTGSYLSNVVVFARLAS